MKYEKKFHSDVDIAIRWGVCRIRNFMKNRFFRANLSTVAGARFPMIKKLVSGDSSRSKSVSLLSVQCRELEPVRKQLEARGWHVEDLNVKKIRPAVTGSYALAGRLTDAIFRDEFLKPLFDYCGVDYLPLVMRKLPAFIISIGYYFDLYKRLVRYLENNNYSIVFLQSLSAVSFDESPLAAYACHRLKIPYVCWMHGGLGAYDISPTSVDLPYAHHYFVYGEKVKEKLKSIQPDVVMHVAGSPMLETLWKCYRKTENNKKVVLVCLPHSDLHNNLSLRNSYPNFHFSGMPTITRILAALVSVQDEYKIVVKMNGEDYRPFLRDYIENIGANFSLIGRENHFQYLLDEADLIVLTWASTSFWQAAATKADIFLIDEGKLTPDAEAVVNKRAFYFRDVEVFLKQLHAYLLKGMLYQKPNGDFLSAYADTGSTAGRADKINDLIKMIIENPRFRSQWGSIQTY